MYKPENQAFRAIQVVRVDGQIAAFVGVKRKGMQCTFDDFEENTGITRQKLVKYGETGEEFFMCEDELPYTATFITTESMFTKHPVYEFVSENGSERFMVDEFGHNGAFTPAGFTKQVGIPFVEVEQHADSQEALEIPGLGGRYMVTAAMKYDAPFVSHSVLSDLYDGIIRLRLLDEEDRDRVVTKLISLVGELSEFAKAA